MAIDELITELGYADSPHFLRAEGTGHFSQTVDYGHIFRRAADRCGLQGVYTLQRRSKQSRDAIVPVVYVCKADDDHDAERIHRLVWNQNIAPFLIIVSRRAVRLYSGFRYAKPGTEADPERSGLLRAAETFEEAMSFLDSFRADQIDNGSVWDEWGKTVKPETRVDWNLLARLNALDSWLQANGLEPKASHGLIGKFVYLYYLRHRNILSDRKLAKWKLEKQQLFSRHATLTAFWSVVDKLDEWLNGSTFPLDRSDYSQLKANQLQKVAGTFAGDDPASGQLALDFEAYDFSFIPIETLSVIYEQFLHAPTEGASSGKNIGAYYTPIPLVNFMLEELDSLHPFRKGMRVLDPSCGSGAFLVQCYRRIIEHDEEFTPGEPMRPSRLRDLLQDHIFGIDRDRDACRVAELSLSLTLLDYVDPPDLERTPQFRLPSLHGSNIFEGDFFDPAASWRETLAEMKFDWIVGNPPWVELKRGRIAERDRHVWSWMQDPENQRDCPIGGNQVAEAFAWEVTRHLASRGDVGLLLPAMTLFKDESAAFRRGFFEKLAVRSVANFSNLAYVLFPGRKQQIGRRTRTVRPERPAAALFYRRGSPDHRSSRPIWVFSPLVADQPANRPATARSRTDIWSIVVSANQVQAIEVEEAINGGLLPWKLAMWGSHLDARLLKSVSKRFASFRDFCIEHSLTTGQGFELRSADTSEPIDEVPEIEGRWGVKPGWLRRDSRVFEYPPSALERIDKTRCYVRRGRGAIPLKLSWPPHIFVDKVRRYAIYSDEFIAAPVREIGIAGDESKKELLKALSLYLVSDFAIYHQFLVSPEWGISTSVSTLNALRLLPIPLGELSESQLSEWANLHSAIVSAARGPIASGPGSQSLDSLLRALNERVYEALGLRDDEKALVSDLVNIRMKLVKGKVPRDAIRSPNPKELTGYATQLKDELNSFVADQPGLNHTVVVAKGTLAGIVAVTLKENSSSDEPVRIVGLDGRSGESLDSVRNRVNRQHGQWIYFERNLRLYEGRTTYLFKPLEKLHWSATQAQLDAGVIIAETLT